MGGCTDQLADERGRDAADAEDGHLDVDLPLAYDDHVAAVRDT